MCENNSIIIIKGGSGLGMRLGRESVLVYSSIVPCTAVVRIKAKTMNDIHNVWCYSNCGCNNCSLQLYQNSLLRLTVHLTRLK